ncbi:unnamed protein product [Laminaria digitata]
MEYSSGDTRHKTQDTGCGAFDAGNQGTQDTGHMTHEGT